MKKNGFLMFVMVAVLCFGTVVCFADGVTVGTVSFANRIGPDGNPTDDIVMTMGIDMPANTNQITLCVFGDDITDVETAQQSNKLIHIDQFDAPRDNKLIVTLSKAAILSATGASDADGATIYVRLGADTVDSPENEAVVISLSSVKTGDIDGDSRINDSDAIYLMYYTFFPDDYPVNQDCDFDGDGQVTDSDAIYLMYYTFFPDDYPLPE
ncbi:MAG: hypothetical protein IJP38_10345 [Oscillospiraceae bacterium]|nr:hypothetical protein [Oscillospiraceae bacterium]